MKQLLATTALALCLGGTAHAQMERLSGGGFWATYGGRNDAGRLQCSMRTSYQVSGQMEGALTIIYDSGQPNQLGIQILKRTWNIPQGAQMRVALQVDNAPVQVFNAHQWYRPQEVELEMSLSDIDPNSGTSLITTLTNLFANGRWLRVWFPDGSEGVWTANLNGSTAALGTFANCIRATEPSQPASQPYGNRQQLPPTRRVTQPYTPL